MSVTHLEPWLDKRGLAAHLCCSIRSVETALAEGLPHAVIFGRVKFQVSAVEPWLEAHGCCAHTGTSTSWRSKRSTRCTGR
jgi:hypothetical protein